MPQVPNLETAHSLLPISAARRPPAVEACFLPRSLLQGGATGFSVAGIAAEPQATKPQSSGVARSMSYVC